MPSINFPKVDSGISVEQLADIVARLIKEVEWLATGNLDSANAREFGGWQVNKTELRSKDGDVGMSTSDTGADDIRFWAGDAISGTPKFKVTKAGILTAISMILQSVASGERVAIDATGFHSYDPSGVERITIGTTPAKGAKAIIGRDSSGNEQSVYTYDTETVDGASRTGQYLTAHGAYLLLSSDGDVRLIDSSGKGFRAVSGTPEMSDGFGWYTIAKQGASTSTNGLHDHGISSGVKLATTSDGSTVDGYVTWVPSGSHNHTQS